MSKPKGIAILIPSSGRHVHPQWAIALRQLAAPVGQSLFIFINYPDSEALKRGEFTRARQREQLVEAALKVNPEYLMWVDDDTIPPPSAILELFFVLAQNPKAMICGGIYCTKTEPPQPIVFMDYGSGPHWLWTFGDVFKCKGLGTGCMLVRADVMRKIEKPWFKDTSESKLGDTELIDGNLVNIASRTGTDDIYFCKKVDALGYDIIAHGGVLPAHMDYETDLVYKIPVNSYPVQSYQERLDKVNAGLPESQKKVLL